MSVIIGTLVNVALLMYLSRRLLGVPVGWGRTLVVSALQNMVGWYAAEQVVGTLGVTADTPTLPVLLVVVVLGGCIIAFDLIVLTVLEAIIPTWSVPTLTSVVTGFPSAVRRLRRYVVIWWILLKNGLTAYIGPAPKRDLDSPRVARSLRKALTEAGVTFVKFGQMLSTRADLLPASYVRELSKLHSDVEAEPWKDVSPVLTEALPRPSDEVFKELDETPMAAASVAQIHGATLLDGTPVVVKLQRPQARRQVTADLDILRRLAVRLEKRTRWGRQLGVVALADGFADSLHEELDYTVEVGNMRSVAAASDLLVPTPYPELSSERVIVMQRIAGRPLSSAAEQLAALSDEQRAELADRLLSGVLRQIFVHGAFHAVLHPGNVILTDDGDLALLDFGSVGRLDRPTRSALTMLLYAVERQDSIAATDALLDLMDRPSGLDDRELEREVGKLMLRFGDGFAPGGAGTMFAELLNVVVRFGFRVPPQLAGVFRTLGTLDGTLQLIDPDVDLIGIARDRGSELAQSLLGRDAIREQAEHQLATLMPMLSRLPRRLSRITEQLEDGTLSVNIRPLGDASDRSWIARVGSQLNLSLLGCALLFGGLFLLTRAAGPMLLPTVPLWPILGAALLFVAFILAARVLAGVFIADRE